MARKERDIKSYIYLLQWIFIALIAGPISSLFIQGFLWAYERIIDFTVQMNKVPLMLWPVAGAIVVGMIVYPLEPRAKGEGIPSYLISMREGNGRLSARETFYKIWAALITLGTQGNGGFLGPLGRISAGLMSLLYRWIPRKLIPREHLSLFSICGLAAAFAALVHSSIGAGIFAVEIIQKANMRYRQLFPAILASTSSVFFSRWMGFEPVIPFHRVQEPMNVNIMGILLLLIIVSGFAGKGFIILYGKVSSLFHRDWDNLSPIQVTLRLVLGSVLAFSLCLLINPQLLGTSKQLFSSLLQISGEIEYGNLPAGIPLYGVLILFALSKALANSFTVGSGMSAGFAGPAMLIGLLLGAACADLFNIPTGSPDYFALLAAGFAGVFSSTMNTPIATGILTLELFGLHYSLPAGLASVVGFQINRHHTLYDMVLDEE